MEDVIYYNELYDLYGMLLTDKQKKYFEDYYFNNLSLGEMAELYDVSRNAIFKQIHNVVDKLVDYESKLNLYKNRQILLEISEKLTDKELKDKLEDIINNF
ncbi:MAG: hypothetical protein E7160_03560 [Firmicutes bacterium]|nr:hypothetical protein [Bacillota bacterium]